MKKITILIALFTLSLSLVGCSYTKDKNSNTVMNDKSVSINSFNPKDF